jgi:hypothetical protein
MGASVGTETALCGLGDGARALGARATTGSAASEAVKAGGAAAGLAAKPPAGAGMAAAAARRGATGRAGVARSSRCAGRAAGALTWTRALRVAETLGGTGGTTGADGSEGTARRCTRRAAARASGRKRDGEPAVARGTRGAVAGCVEVACGFRETRCTATARLAARTGAAAAARSGAAAASRLGVLSGDSERAGGGGGPAPSGVATARNGSCGSGTETSARMGSAA